MSYADNPKAPKGGEISESTGPVAKDSLAADSIRASGGFSENKNPEILGVKGEASTLANTDTSGAETLPPASSSADRESSDAKGLDSIGKAKFEGVTNQDGYIGSSGGSNQTATDINTAVDPSSTTSKSTSGSNDEPASDAPSYVGDHHTTADLKVKGSNLREDAGIPANRDTYTQDVGGPKDPARLAEQTMLADSADASSGVAARDKSEVESTSGQYEVLNSEEAS